MKFNPPPNWPVPPEGWEPEPGWEPDPSWGPPPYGWPLWIADDGTVPPVVTSDPNVSSTEGVSGQQGPGHPFSEDPGQKSKKSKRKIIFGSIAAAVLLLIVLPLAFGGGSDSASIDEDAEPAAVLEEETSTEPVTEVETEATEEVTEPDTIGNTGKTFDELRDLSQYAEISERDWKLVERDPDSHISEQYIVYGRVTQADAATGDFFRVDTSGVYQESEYDYEVNTMVAPMPDEDAEVVSGDIVKMYITVSGSYSYDTAIGGTAQAVLGIVADVEILG
jgi:hypothetical protein